MKERSTNGLTADSLGCARVADNLVDHVASAVKRLIVAAAEFEVGGAVDRGGDGTAEGELIHRVHGGRLGSRQPKQVSIHRIDCRTVISNWSAASMRINPMRGYSKSRIT